MTITLRTQPAHSQARSIKRAQLVLALLVLFVQAASDAHAQTSPVLLLATNSVWNYFKGTKEASQPDTSAWRGKAFDDSGWLRGAAPFSYGEDAIADGTRLSDMQNNYSTMFLRRWFNLTDASALAELVLSAVCDDGFIAWINGREVARYNAPEGVPTCNSTASANAAEPAGFDLFPVSDLGQFVQSGSNILAVQVFNVSPGSSDIVFDLQLEALLSDRDSPVIASVEPSPGPVTRLTQMVVTFNEPVAGVDARDLRVNDIPATSLSGTGAEYTFEFAQPFSDKSRHKRTAGKRRARWN